MSAGQWQQQRGQLLGDALSHGPYLWTNRDVENALLWFQPSSLAAGRENSNDDKSGNDNSEGCEFLRRLLHARGIEMPRPLPERSKRSGRKKQERLGGGNSSHDNNSGQEKVAGRKRSRTATSGDKCEHRATTESKSPLESVLTGYYQLFLTQSSSALSKTELAQPPSKSDGDGNDDSDHFTAADIQNAEKSSEKLVSDLTSIILARRHNNEVYRAFTNVVNREINDSVGKARRPMPRTALEMSQAIDEYMMHPTTCVRRVYTSGVFDRLLDLCQGVPEAIAATADGVGGIPGDGKSNSNPTLHSYLKKLFGLAVTNAKIKEVILLMLLEPLRRLQAKEMKLQRGCETKHGPWTPSKFQTIHKDPLSNSQKPHENQKQSPDMELAPLLMSVPFWCSVSRETMERLCSRPPLTALVRCILQTSPKSKPRDNNREYSTTSRAAAAEIGDKHDPIWTIVWWTLSSPLLCTISQMYFPIACEYVRYWIDRAVIGHEHLYNRSPSTKRSGDDNGLHDSISDNEESFQHAIQRIKQFRLTSQRLDLLCSHILHSVEKESKDEFEMSLSGEDDAFRNSLAWKAINRLL